MYVSTGGVCSPGSFGHIRLCGRHQAGQTGRALSKSNAKYFIGMQTQMVLEPSRNLQTD